MYYNPKSLAVLCTLPLESATYFSTSTNCSSLLFHPSAFRVVYR